MIIEEQNTTCSTDGCGYGAGSGSGAGDGYECGDGDYFGNWD